jgi:hypothetical protein
MLDRGGRIHGGTGAAAGRVAGADHADHGPAAARAEIQEAVLFGADPVGLRKLLAFVQLTGWQEQKVAWCRFMGQRRVGRSPVMRSSRWEDERSASPFGATVR